MRSEIETLAELDAVSDERGTLSGHLVQSLDLTGRGAQLSRLLVRNTVFLGCTIEGHVAEHLIRRGAVVFPRLPDVPFDAYRAALYTPDELYAGLEGGYPATLDGRVYDWTRHDRSRLLDATLAQALHDHFISDALDELVTEPARTVGVMGGHALQRGTAGYLLAAQLGAALADRGRMVLTGGGPGAMEAANLGAALGGGPALDAACAELARVPGFADSVDAWAAAGLAVCDGVRQPRETVGIPTWFYGHEPPNVFATHIAKYFDNAIREDILLRLCGGGILFVQGAAGTVQEIFQAVTRNYYALAAEQVRPLVLLGSDYWTTTVPVWPLLRSLAEGRLMADRLFLVDDVEAAVTVLAGGD
ncbi:LOG family protein [Nigerium massiliense]|uniref:LOG family protein n=1 Tax=Nigerium massiliense TaxID=1522317 RepID=UPI0005909B60|nr:hypothetical protein [Nigerium massiliense]